MDEFSHVKSSGVADRMGEELVEFLDKKEKKSGIIPLYTEEEYHELTRDKGLDKYK